MNRPDLIVGSDLIARCGWVGNDLDYARYHDQEWGVPQRQARALFEKLCLEGFQAGLSWLTILRRRENFRAAFAGFDPPRLASWGAAEVDELMANPGIIRHRGKIEATIANARAYLALPRPLDEVIWSYAPAPRRDPQRPQTLADLAPRTAESIALSAALRGYGFQFVGPTTMYALMQSCGLVDDHLVGCHRATAATTDA